MRVHLGTDHAGLSLKDHLVQWLRENGHDPVDHGATEVDPEDDYPAFVMRAATAVVAEPGSLGVVIGGSGNGEAIAANKVPGVRAALVWRDDLARLGRQHNDANVISVGARMHEPDEVAGFVSTFLTTPFSGDVRHQRRITQIADYERTGELPPLGGVRLGLSVSAAYGLVGGVRRPAPSTTEPGGDRRRGSALGVRELSRRRP